MATLFLMRHAQTENYNPGGDKARTLTPNGRTQAKAAGLELAGRGVQMVLCSTATRTRQTLTELGLGDVPVQFIDALYGGSVQTYLQHISEVPDEVATLLVIGHCPAVSTLSAQLAWDRAPQAADGLQGWFPTSTVSEFRTVATWQQLAAGHSVADFVDVRRPSQNG